MSPPPGPLRRWVLAARIRTLPAAIVPVVVGASAVHPAAICWGRSIECAAIALSLQVGTNFANDYSDGVRGTDEQRVGPFRLTASKLVAPTRVRGAAMGFFALAAVVGLVLAAQTSWWLLPLGVSAIVAGWLYTGGPRPYGYLGLGELFVMVYFGFVATIGTSYVQDLHIVTRAWWLAVAVGAAACVLLESNNLRDIDGDRAAGKKTLAARLGRQRAAFLVALFVALIVAGTAYVSVVAALGAAVLYGPSLVLAFSRRVGRDLIILLKVSANAQLLLGVTLVAACELTR